MTYKGFLDMDMPQNRGETHMSEIKAPPKHQWVETGDGTYTLFSEHFQEACHSSTGAKEETLLHYIKGCQIEEKAKAQDQLTILEVGFGLGIGFLTTLEVLKDHTKPWTFLSLEMDEELLEWFRGQHPELNLVWSKNGGVKTLSGKFKNLDLIILCGNARETLPAYVKLHPLKWNAIYQDAFSPKKNPILWTKEWFEFLKTHSSADAQLSTYSASTSIRKSLLESGWSLHKGEKFGPKRTSTRANLSGMSDPEILLHLERSPVTALKD